MQGQNISNKTLIEFLVSGNFLTNIFYFLYLSQTSGPIKDLRPQIQWKQATDKLVRHTEMSAGLRLWGGYGGLTATNRPSIGDSFTYLARPLT